MPYSGGPGREMPEAMSSAVAAAGGWCESNRCRKNSVRPTARASAPICRAVSECCAAIDGWLHRPKTARQARPQAMAHAWPTTALRNRAPTLSGWASSRYAVGPSVVVSATQPIDCPMAPTPASSTADSRNSRTPATSRPRQSGRPPCPPRPAGPGVRGASPGLTRARRWPRGGPVAGSSS